MKIIKQIDSQIEGNRSYTYALFLCPYCNGKVSKRKRDGLKANCCSHKCYARNRKKRGPYKKKIISKKYVYIYIPEHPHAIGTRKLYVAEHRLTMEKKIKRYLTDKEVVHHINGNTLDNRAENLQLMTASSHSRHHKQKVRRQSDGKFTV